MQIRRCSVARCRRDGLEMTLEDCGVDWRQRRRRRGGSGSGGFDFCWQKDLVDPDDVTVIVKIVVVINDNVGC